MFRTFKVFLPEALFPTDKNVVKLLGKLCGVNKAVFTDNKDIMEHWKCLLKYNNPMAMGFHRIDPLNPDEIAILSEKALFIIGNRDPINPAGSVKNLEANSQRFIVIDGAGHGINHEFSDVVNKAICDFMKSLIQ